MNNNKYNLEDDKIADNEGNDSFEPEKQVNINRYHDRDGASLAKLELGLWYVENRTKIIEAFYFVLFLLALLCWVYFFYEFGSYVVKGIPSDKMITQEVLANNLPEYSYYLNQKPVDLKLYPAKTILGMGNKRDILAKISNPNSDYWARFTYYFLNNKEKIGEKKGFILPGETKQLLVLGRDIPASIGGIHLVIEDLKWGRVNPHRFGAWDKFKNNHLNINFSNIVFAPSSNSSLTEKVPLNNLSFHAENKTSFNYWNVPIIISLYNYSDLVSVSTYEINDFESLSEKDISFTLPGNFRKITNIKIAIDLDISRDDLYKDFEAPKTLFR